MVSNLRENVFKSLPPQLPALLRARDVYKQIQKKDLDSGGLVDVAATEELAGNLSEQKAGKRLFEIAAACRVAGIDPESALRRYASHVVETIEGEY